MVNEHDEYADIPMKLLENSVGQLIRNGRVFYSRGGLKQAGYSFEDKGEKGVQVNAPSLDSLARKGSQQLSDEGDDRQRYSQLRGTCRDIAPAIGAFYVERGDAQDYQTMACYQGKETEEGLSPNEYHYVTILEVEGGKVLVDMGYNQPIPVPVKIDGGPVESDFYAESQPKGFYGGIVVYEAKSQPDGSVILTIGTPENPTQYKKFQFKPVDSKLDEAIVAKFGQLTGKNYATYPVVGEDGYFMQREDIEGENLLGDLNALLADTSKKASAAIACA